MSLPGNDVSWTADPPAVCFTTENTSSVGLPPESATTQVPTRDLIFSNPTLLISFFGGSLCSCLSSPNAETATPAASPQTRIERNMKQLLSKHRDGRTAAFRQ